MPPPTHIQKKTGAEKWREFQSLHQQQFQKEAPDTPQIRQLANSNLIELLQGQGMVIHLKFLLSLSNEDIQTLETKLKSSDKALYLNCQNLFFYEEKQPKEQVPSLHKKIVNSPLFIAYCKIEKIANIELVVALLEHDISSIDWQAILERFQALDTKLILLLVELKVGVPPENITWATKINLTALKNERKPLYDISKLEHLTPEFKQFFLERLEKKHGVKQSQDPTNIDEQLVRVLEQYETVPLYSDEALCYLMNAKERPNIKNLIIAIQAAELLINIRLLLALEDKSDIAIYLTKELNANKTTSYKAACQLIEAKQDITALSISDQVSGGMQGSIDAMMGPLTAQSPEGAAAARGVDAHYHARPQPAAGDVRARSEAAHSGGTFAPVPEN